MKYLQISPADLRSQLRPEMINFSIPAERPPPTCPTHYTQLSGSSVGGGLITSGFTQAERKEEDSKKYLNKAALMRIKDQSDVDSDKVWPTFEKTVQTISSGCTSVVHSWGAARGGPFS